MPENYSILLLHGGAIKSQSDSVPMNLCPELNNKCRAKYLISRSWSKMVANGVQSIKQGLTDNFTRLLEPQELLDHDDVCYRYYCDNETIQDVEFNCVPECKTDLEVPLVCDMTSNFLSRPIDISKLGAVFAGTQKNCGRSRLTITINFQIVHISEAKIAVILRKCSATVTCFMATTIKWQASL